MNAHHKQRKFKLIEVVAFDARRGYTRCKTPGVCISLGNRTPNPIADFWWNKKGGLFVRFSCYDGYVCHFEAKRTGSKKISENDLDDFEEYIADTLLEWVIEGVDEIPSSCSSD